MATRTKARMYGALVGIVALSASMFGMLAPAGAQVEPTAPDDESADDAAGVAATGEYEACTENFGLGKVVEIVVEVDGEVPTPPLTFPQDVSIVTTWESASGVATCIPEPVTPELWASESFWGGSFGLPMPVGNYVFLPFDDEEEMCEVSHTLTLVEAPAEYTITVGEAVVPPPAITIFCDGGDPIDYLFEQAAPLMTAAQLTALENFVDPESFPVEGCNEDDSGTPSEDLAGAAAALVDALSPDFLAFYEDLAEGETACDQVSAALEAFFIQVVYDAEVGRQAIFDLTAPEAPLPVEPAAPAAAAVVQPRFTG